MCSLPNPYSFVVINLEPSLSVAHLNVPELTEACSKLNTKKYVAYVGEREQDVVKPHVPYHSFLFYLVYQGLRRLKDGRVGPEVCYPVLPNTSHPLSRSPLDPGRPLPWDNCYISEFVSFPALCPTVICETKPSSLYELTRIAGVDLECSMADDCCEWRGYSTDGQSEYRSFCSGHDDKSFVVERPSLKNTTEVQIRSTAGIDFGDFHESHAKSGFNIYEPSLSQSEKDMDAHVQQIIREHPHNMFELLDVLESERAAKQDDDVSSNTASMTSMLRDKVVVKTSFDLTEVEQVNDPAEFFREVEALYQLKQVHEAILMQREIEAARKVDDQYFAQIEKEKGPELSPKTNICALSGYRRFVGRTRKLLGRMKETLRSALCS
ncbi:hypothetical protein E1B28_011006 [Marasmius oreades]|uniref:Uncharacterized protein n=1 Tax=Marasmius oreades TaxID=181124 RepID=A0A9P7RTB2_9AGAR|nr:uncharacterized protein E1B28_011006 [Marasmius oreades]KAG7089310.1 hypothetical protein E1B28_011006 [Marasmius oreades]